MNNPSNLKQQIVSLRKNARTAIGNFDKTLEAVGNRAEKLVARARREAMARITEFIRATEEEAEDAEEPEEAEEL
jgi:hypothetical protein